MKLLKEQDNVKYFEMKLDNFEGISLNGLHNVFVVIDKVLNSQYKYKALLLTDIDINSNALSIEFKNDKFYMYYLITLIDLDGNTEYLNVQVVVNTDKVIKSLGKPSNKFLPFMKSKTNYGLAINEVLEKFFSTNRVFVGNNNNNFELSQLRLNEVNIKGVRYLIHYNGENLEISANIIRVLRNGDKDISEKDNIRDENDINVVYLGQQRLAKALGIQYQKLSGRGDNNFDYLNKYRSIQQRLAQVESFKLFKDVFKESSIQTNFGSVKYLKYEVNNEQLNYHVYFLFTQFIFVDIKKNKVVTFNIEEMPINEFVDMLYNLMPVKEKIKYDMKRELNTVYDLRRKI